MSLDKQIELQKTLEQKEHVKKNEQTELKTKPRTINKKNKKDKEKTVALKQIEEELSKENTNKVLLKRMEKLVKLFKKNKIWAEVEISGELYKFAFSSIEKKGKPQKFNKLLEKIKTEKIDLSNITVIFNVDNIQGRRNHLFLTYIVPIIELLQGGGSIENKLRHLVNNDFGGLYEHKKKQDKEMELLNETNISLVSSDEFKKTKDSIIDKLKSKNIKITAIETDESFILSAEKKDFNKQVVISTLDKSFWHVEIEEDRRRVRKHINLKPKELLPLIDREI
ncbi:hypothetical protein GF340_05725 [Candidatus Peregrinibacteria bacterium]|nr:hypothetical protein [Candidatus Peregrinibacteria bacterium]